MSKIRLVIIRWPGEAIFDIDNTLWGIVAISGLDTPSIELYTEKLAIGDGDVVTGSRVGGRSIEMTLRTKTVAFNNTLRRVLTSFFNPTFTFDIYVFRQNYNDQAQTNQGFEIIPLGPGGVSPIYPSEYVVSDPLGNRYAKGCRLDSIEVPTGNLYAPLTAKLEFINTDGYYLSTDDFGENIAAIEARCGYPYISVAGKGRVYGVYSYAQVVYLDNDGDAEAYCRAVFVARGVVTNPKLMAANGFVRVITTIHAGDELVIDGQTKGVTINGANASNLIDKNSSFTDISLAIGSSPISYTADIGSNLLDVYVYYNKRYLGA